MCAPSVTPVFTQSYRNRHGSKPAHDEIATWVFSGGRSWPSGRLRLLVCHGEFTSACVAARRWSARHRVILEGKL